MITRSAMTMWPLTITASGTETLPTTCKFSTADEYEVVTVEGNGSVDAASKTATAFDYTVIAGPCKVEVQSKIPGRLMEHID